MATSPVLGISDAELYVRHVLALNTRLLCPAHGVLEPVVGHNPEGFILQCGGVRPPDAPRKVKIKPKGGALGSFGPELKLFA